MAKILVVDDEWACAFFLSTFLSERGHDVKTAAKGTEAIECGLDFRPDVLVCDWMLKDSIDGLEVATRLHEDRPDLKIIFMTGLPADSIVGQHPKLPVFKVLEKPLDLMDIVTEIHGVLGNGPGHEGEPQK